MSGFERFDPRTWAEGGVTHHIAAVARDSVASMRRVGAKLSVQTTIAVTAALTGSATYAADASAQTIIQQRVVAEAPASAIVSEPRGGMLASIPLSAGHAAATATADERALAMQSAFHPDLSELRSGTYEQFGTARQRFLNRQPAQMSDRTRALAETLMAQRDAENGETGTEWAERLMKNMYS